MDKKNKTPEKEERDKRLVMWTGVSFFMFLIIFLWFLNTRTVFFNINNAPKENQFNLEQVSQEFDNILEEAGERIEDIEIPIDFGEEENTLTDPTNAEVELEETKEEVTDKIEVLKNKLEAS